MAIELPKKKIEPVSQDPNNLILFGPIKIGKTTIVAELDNCLILDFEKGSDYVSALKIKVNDIPHLKEICTQINKEGCPYDFIAIDTITALEDFSKPLALSLYKASPLGVNSDITDILKLPRGAGYMYLREAIEKLIAMISSVCKHVILIGHVKDSAIGNDEEEVNVKTLDLTGKIKRITASKSDAIGLVYRDDDSNLCVSFVNNGEVEVGARPAHLANKKVIVAEMQEDGTFVSHWERIYPSLNK